MLYVGNLFGRLCDGEPQRGNDSESSSKPTEFILHLKPHQGTANTNEVYAKLDLRVQLCKSYPESSQLIQLEEGHGISLKDIENLKKELENLCHSGKGEEIGLVLAQHVQGYLAERNVQPRFESFHEEMIVAQRIERRGEEYLTGSPGKWPSIANSLFKIDSTS